VRWLALIVIACAAIAGVLTLLLRARTREGARTRDGAREWREAHELLNRALELPDDERREMIERYTRTKPALKREVELLLEVHDSTGPLDRLHSLLFTGGCDAAAEVGGDGTGQTIDPARGGAGDLMHPALVADHYELLGELGAGGMGVVHRARDTRLGREVALKFLPRQRDTSSVARERFIREARAAAALDHPNLCTIHEIGESDDGGMFIAMALYDGETLAARIERGAIYWEDAVDIAMQVARGLAVAHAAGVVHRDIKPANLCITSDGVVKIVDFGIAMVADSTLADAGPFLGTLAYLSPEQARGDRVDHRTDLWSLGVVLYEMLTGARLFQGDHWARLLADIRDDSPVPLGALRSAAPLAVIRIVRQLLARDPGERPSGAEAVLHALAEAVAALHDRTEEMADSGAGLARGGERRQVTIVNSLLLASVTSNDAARFATAAGEVVESHGGVLIRSADGSMIAVFGVPVTREDDLLRAARAAFDLHELAALGEEEECTSIATGIARGSADVREAAESKGMYELTGAALDRAARIAGGAPPGSILLADPDWCVVEQHFTLEPWRTLPGEGGRGHIPVVRLLARRSGSADADNDREARLTRFVGRERELAALAGALDSAVTGEGRVAVIVGEAGTGKSRLLRELRQRLGDRAIRMVVGRCQSYAGSKPYHAFEDAVRDVLSLDGEDRYAADAKVVEAAIDAVDPLLDPFKKIYLQLLGILPDSSPLQPPQRGESARRAIIDALTALFTVASESAPLVLVLEDWHWSDDASADVLRELAEVGASYPILIVVTFRPGYGVDADRLRAKTSIQLSPLAIGDTAAMISALLDANDVPDDVAGALHERSGGNPFYLEELCRSMRETGMLRGVAGRAELSSGQEHRHLPGTIQGVIRSRLDRLSPSAREVVRAAAVLGRDFTHPLLEAMGMERYELSRVLPTLATLGIVRRVRVVPEHSFRFSHVLIHDVAYDTLLPQQLIELHERAARAIANVYAGRLDEHAARLAWHFRNCEAWLEAARYGRLGAQRSVALGEHVDALEILQSIEEWLSLVPDGKAHDEMLSDVLLDQERICETLGFQDRQGEILERLLGLSQVRADRVRLAEVHRRKGDRLTLLRDFDGARSALHTSLDLVRERGDAVAEAMVLRSLGFLGWHSGELELALEYLDRALVIERARADHRAIVVSLSARAQVLKALGRVQEAMDDLNAAIDALEGTDNEHLISAIYYIRGTLYRTLGDLDGADESFGLAWNVVTGARNPVYDAFYLAARAHVSLARGELDRALEEAEDSVTLARRIGYADGLARSLHSLGELLTRLGRHGEALDHFTESATVFRQLGRAGMERSTVLRTALIAERVRDFDCALQAWARLCELEAERGDVAAELKARVGVARTVRRIDPSRAAECTAELERTLRLAKEAGEPGAEAESRNSLGIAAWERGDFEVALDYFESALELFRAAGDERHAAVMLNCVGATFRAMERPGEARRYLVDGRDLARGSGSQMAEAHAEALLGDIELDANDGVAAREHYENSLALRLATGDRRGEGWMRLALARVECRLGRRDSARESLEQALDIATAMEDAELRAGAGELERSELQSEEV